MLMGTDRSTGGAALFQAGHARGTRKMGGPFRPFVGLSGVVGVDASTGGLMGLQPTRGDEPAEGYGLQPVRQGPNEMGL
jgi:hypothetical protein